MKSRRKRTRGIRIQSAAGRYQSASRPVRHQTGGSEESPRDCGLRHYNHANYLALEKEDPNRAQELIHEGKNVILVGPTGVGKNVSDQNTFADLIKVPFVKADATKFSETGYVWWRRGGSGARVVHQGDATVNLAQFGIIYIDEESTRLRRLET